MTSEEIFFGYRDRDEPKGKQQWLSREYVEKCIDDWFINCNEKITWIDVRRLKTRLQGIK